MHNSTNKNIAIVSAHKIWNVPPLLNVPQVLAAHGWDTTVIGYQGDDLPAEENLGSSARIRRLHLKSRGLPSAVLRKAFSTLEFLSAARRLVRDLRPSVLICMNEPASILLRRAGDIPLKVAWPLEFPEFEMFKPPERLLWRYSAASWPRADFIVAPTATRLALSCGLHRDLIRGRGFVVHNAPLAGAAVSPDLSERALEAIAWMSEEQSAGRVCLVQAGAVGDRYGVNRLIEAVADTTGISLLILGKKHDLAEREVARALRDANDASRVNWIDEVSYRELAAVLARSDAGFVHYVGDTINTRFSAPGKIYEYLRAGMAIVTDDDCCIKSELAASGVGFFFHRPGTRAGIGEALRRLSASKNKLKEMKQAAQRMFAEEFNLERQMAPLLEAMEQHFKIKP